MQTNKSLKTNITRMFCICTKFRIYIYIILCNHQNRYNSLQLDTNLYTIEGCMSFCVCIMGWLFGQEYSLYKYIVRNEIHVHGNYIYLPKWCMLIYILPFRLKLHWGNLVSWISMKWRWWWWWYFYLYHFVLLLFNIRM